jgi:hypothetical protein
LILDLPLGAQPNKVLPVANKQSGKPIAGGSLLYEKWIGYKNYVIAEVLPFS